ncbi:hypothetical protein EVAR_72233_1 [Eumeta japonica]|uniref:Uncharacterized protein n=1 Tax=Eumeta variegata TaxID=151549 RepID=A0A4C1THW8_EUMVA|nr:hypothetical protein EVAR_72233_1 [Eumeta japonica]
MTSNIGFYAKSKFFDQVVLRTMIYLENEEDDENVANQYMYEVPYTSSSVDRSSIGSIPWADDAIKINKMEWEKVEKMLSGLEPLSDAEGDISKEILDWQRKFPQLLHRKQHKSKTLRSDTLDVESLPSFEIRSYDEDYETDGNVTPTRKFNIPAQPERKSSEEDSNNICQLMENITLRSVPFKLSQRELTRAATNKRNCTSSTSSYSLRSPTPPKQVPVVSTSIVVSYAGHLNVLDTYKKFRSLGQTKNPSFVQLTQIQQATSAAVTQEQKSQSRFLTGRRSAWHVPFVANRFSNNRNSIILPSITQIPTTTSSTSEGDTLNVKSSLT